ncbi:hypothetical protein Tco_1368149 [Tanacetum coccineum]
MYLVNNNIGDIFDFPRADLKDVSKHFPKIGGRIALLVNSYLLGIFILVDRIPELVHVNFRNICSDEKCGISRSESKSIQDNLKWIYPHGNAIESDEAFCNRMFGMEQD